MRKRLFTGIPFIVLGFFIAIGPTTIFPVCAVTDMIMKCHWTAQAELGVGLSIAVLGILALFLESQTLGLMAAVFLNGIIALLFPVVLIGVCPGAHMPCHMLTRPALILLSSITIVLALLQGVLILRKSRTVKA